MNQRPNDRVLERHLAYKWAPFTRTKILEKYGVLPIVRGKGARVYDLYDKEYIDCHAALWLTNVGFGRTEIADAVYAQMKEIAFFSSFEGHTTLPSIDLAERMIELLEPEGMDKIFFSNSGSEAVETALKIARQYWRMKGRGEKYKFITRERAYHGVTLGGLSVGGMAINRRMFEPLLPGCRHAPAPDCYRFDVPDAEARGHDCALAIENLIRQESPDTVAAVIVEPVQGAGGAIVPSDNYHRELREICTRYDILLIFDEVVTGFGRLGSWFAARHWNIRPDMMCFAKGITSGYIPLGATAVSGEIARTFLEHEASHGAFRHGNTYSGHPAACAAAMANIDILEREKLIENAARMGAYLWERMASLQRHNVVGHANGLGLIGRVQLVEDRVSGRYFDPKRDIAGAVARRLTGLGVIVRSVPGDIITLSPPLCISKSEVDIVVAAFDQALGELASGQLAA